MAFSNCVTFCLFGFFCYFCLALTDDCVVMTHDVCVLEAAQAHCGHSVHRERGGTLSFVWQCEGLNHQDTNECFLIPQLSEVSDVLGRFKAY